MENELDSQAHDGKMAAGEYQGLDSLDSLAANGIGLQGALWPEPQVNWAGF